MNDKASSAHSGKLEKMAAVLPAEKRVLIIPHDYPDPDALAAAAAMHVLLWERFGLSSQIVFSGRVSRAENKELLRRMRCRWHLADEMRAPRKSVPCIVVDTAPWSRNVTIPSYAKPVMVIDHHQHQHAVKHSSDSLFVDIRAGAGATTTIAYEYLKEAGIAAPRWLASLMAYAIASETLDLSRDSEKADIDAYVDLATRADLKIIGKIRHAPLPRAYFVHLQEAISSARKLGSLAWSHLRETEQPEIVAEIADLLLRMEGLRWSFCTASLENGLFVSIRSSQRGARCSHLLRSVIGKDGSAGGHHRMAAGFIDMSKLSPVDRENRRREFIHNLTAKIVRRQIKDVGAMGTLTQKLVEKS